MPRLFLVSLLAAAASGASVGSVALARPSKSSRGGEGGGSKRRTSEQLTAAAGRSRAARHLVAGAAAGAISNTLVAPLDILRLNLIVSTDGRGALQLAKDIYARGGIRAFWHGNSADVIRTVPASAIRFYTFALYKGYLTSLQTLPPAAVSLLSGGFAGMSAMAACFPLETVRTRMATLGAAQGVGLIAYTRQLVATDGPSALYRGLTPSLISVMPYFAVRFGTYDILQRWYATAVVDSSDASGEGAAGGGPKASKAQARSDSARRRLRQGLESGRGFSPAAAFGMLAGLSASTTTFPFELVRRRAMVGHSESNPFIAMARIAREEGFRRGLYRGFGLSLIKVRRPSWDPTLRKIHQLYSSHLLIEYISLCSPYIYI